MAATPRLSIVVPVHNEVESLPLLWAELREVLEALEQPAEVVLVDDGSSDGSTEVIHALAAADARVRMVRLARRCGLTAALHAGFRAVRAPVVVTLDADLQSDPHDIPRLLLGLKDADAAVGWRRARCDPWRKRWSSTIANAIRRAVTGDRVRDSACNLRAMSRRCLDAFPPYDGLHRFLPTLLLLAGHRVVEIEVNHRPRRFGRSKFGIRNRALRAFVDLLAVRWMIARRLRLPPAEED